MAASPSLSGLLKRRPFIIFALFVACSSMAIGGSIYFQQKKAKAAAIAAKNESEGRNNDKGLASGANLGTTTPDLGIAAGDSNPQRPTPVPVVQRQRKAIAEQEKQKVAKLVEKLLNEAPAGAGVPDNAPQTEQPQIVFAPIPSPETPPPQLTPPQPAPAPAPIGPVAGPAIPLPPNVKGTDATVATTLPRLPQLPPVSSVPEPSTWLMMAGGLAVLLSRARRSS